jgi:hypothetical protein
MDDVFVGMNRAEGSGHEPDGDGSATQPLPPQAPARCLVRSVASLPILKKERTPPSAGYQPVRGGGR